ncbi:hypothetical protein JCM19239_7056 [Vibrio variabilis]|uniref:Uncharacterized protein n=1 Tax=Vibrio variabilis TaxID=990271 RepID=A0ABQ0JM40_9VIBR|nr:hypothetical protein JCM19239_7056 [Vibrio variabilis]
MMTFLTGGYNYNDGQTMNDGIIERHSGHSGYIGLFALKPINDKLTAMGVVGTTQGKHSSYWGGAGASYLINSNNSFNALLVGVDNSLYGSDNRVVVNYRYEFK